MDPQRLQVIYLATQTSITRGSFEPYQGTSSALPETGKEHPAKLLGSALRPEHL